MVEHLICALGFSMTVIVALQVFFRYALNQSLFWSEELSRYLLVWLTFFGASVGYYRRILPGMDILFQYLPVRLKKASSTVASLASLFLFAVMIGYGYQFAFFVRSQISPALNLPRWVPYSVIPISGAIFILHTIAFMIQDLSEKSHGS
jgi:TRAP-type C4-dicarboxylate transport system permease small subunit